MPIHRKIDLLPASVRSELAAKLRSNAYGNIADVTDWLNGQGFGHIGKSAVGAFSLALKNSDRALGPITARSAAELDLISLRVQCAAVAAQEGRKEDLFERAEEIFNWASKI